MTRVADIFFTVGGITIKLRDLKSYDDSSIITVNGMKIRATAFEIAEAKKRLEAWAKRKAFNGYQRQPAR